MTTKRRSKLEENFEYLLNDLEVQYKYEDTKLTYMLYQNLNIHI